MTATISVVIGALSAVAVRSVGSRATGAAPSAAMTTSPYGAHVTDPPPCNRAPVMGVTNE